MNSTSLRGLLALVSVALTAGTAAGQAVQPEEATVKRLTPVVAVEAIEACIPFWTETLGFEKTMEVPSDDGDGLAFAAFEKGKGEVMYQTWDSLAEDVPSLVPEDGAGPVFLFLEVASVEELDRLDEALADAERVLPRRTTFYGADEIVVQDPCGTIVTLAAFEEGDGEG